MAFTRKIKKPSGTYYALVENHREGKKVVQTVLKYLGTSPNRREIPVDPVLAGQLAQALMSGAASPEEIKKVLNQLGVPIVGRLKRISLVYTPPLRKLTLRIE
jgi:hypothetical protein